MENVVLPLSDRVNKSPFLSKLKQWRGSSKLNREDLEALQRVKLQKMLSHACANSEYYRRQGITERQDPYQWLSSFPVLKKRAFREHLDSFVTVPQDKTLTSIMSSGSSGPPSKVFFNRDELANNRAIQVLWWEWAGYRFGNSILQTGVNMKRSREKRIKDFLLDTRYIDAMTHSDADIERDLNYLEAHPRDHFIAYASSIFLFAKVALEKNITGVKFKSIVSLGEKLLPAFRHTIEKAFDCKVYDTYGASEGFLIASQCSQGHYHIMTPHVVVELLDDAGNEVKPGETGSIVLTGLDNFTTPLIRYEVGDLAVKSSEKNCLCGLHLPILGEIIGRQTEFILTPSGKYITVQNVVRIFKHFPEIEQFKVVQNQTDSILVYYIEDPKATEIRLDQITRMFQDTFREPIEFSFEAVLKIPKSKSGKFQLIERNF